MDVQLAKKAAFLGEQAVLGNMFFSFPIRGFGGFIHGDF